MAKERSAGGVVVREGPKGLEVAVIRPRGRTVYALPKGHLDGAETAAQAAEREVREETGLSAALEGDLGVIKYGYRFGGRFVSKEVAFFLFRATGGEIDALEPRMREEVDQALWVSLDALVETLTYPGERSVAQRARAILLAQAASSPKDHRR
ncbi:MAG: NUDIX hydrolase [Myxococcaceae bacterium]|nr:NUDIX hydrolase [Myxococcaceae bacterium]